MFQSTSDNLSGEVQNIIELIGDSLENKLLEARDKHEDDERWSRLPDTQHNQSGEDVAGVGEGGDESEDCDDNHDPRLDDVLGVGVLADLHHVLHS